MGDWEHKHHWQVINGGGRVISTTPQQLWQQAVTYFEWCDKQPITAKRTLTSGKTQGDKVTVEFNRPYTIEGFCLHAGITKRYLMDLQQMHGLDSEWYHIAEKILTVIYTQNLEGAITDLYNPVIVSKVLNLDKGNEEEARVVRVEIVNGDSSKLANSENEILKNLDYGKLENLKEKLENDKGEATHAH